MKPTVLIIRLALMALFVVLMVLGKPFIWLILFGIGLLLTPLFGRLYCGWACPMNTVMTPVSRLLKKSGRKPKTAPAWLQNGRVAWLSLFLSLALTILGQKVLQRNIPILLIWLVVAVLITIFYKPSVFHNLLCPFGAPLRLLGRFARSSRQVASGACKNHQACLRVCPSDAITVPAGSHTAVIDPALCHQCLNCSSVCPTKAIEYKKR